jgi:tetratricopeptide (TPR) repeat protein
VLLAGFGTAMAGLYRQAQSEADKARQINYFLQDTLASVEPRDGRNDVTVRDLLDEAVWWVGSTLADRPDVEAAIRNTIGNSYRALGALDAAATQLDRALNLRRGLFGEGHTETAESLNSLAWLRRAQGRRDEAEHLFRRALEIRRERLGDDDLDVAMSRMNVATVLADAKRYDEAEAMLRACVEVRRRQLGDGHADAAMAQFRLAELLEARGDLASAETLHRAVREARQRILPDGHPDQGRSMIALGALLLRTGRFDEAEPLLVGGHDLLKNVKGGGAAEVRAAREQIAQLYERWNRPDQAAAWRALD